MITKNIELFPNWKRMNVSLHTQEIIFTGMDWIHACVEVGGHFSSPRPLTPSRSCHRIMVLTSWVDVASAILLTRERYKVIWVNPF